MDLERLLDRLPERPEAKIESPRGSIIKRRPDGGIDFISPIPVPYNYGCIPGLRSDDGDELDAIVLGERRARGTRVRLPVRAVVEFIDAGRADPKVVLSRRSLTRLEIVGLWSFFLLYAPPKRILARLRGQRGTTRVVAVHRVEHRA